MRNKEKQIFISCFAIVIGVIIYFISIQAKVEITPGKGFNRAAYTSRDSVLIQGRHVGDVNLELFSKLIKNVKENSHIEVERNRLRKTVSFNIPETEKNLIFGGDYKNKESWLNQYKNLPIKITKNGFDAPLKEIDDVEYITLPYQLLFDIAKVAYEPSLIDEPSLKSKTVKESKAPSKPSSKKTTKKSKTSTKSKTSAKKKK